MNIKNNRVCYKVYPCLSNRGFTFIELIVVLLLLSIVAATAYLVWPKDDISVTAQAESLASDIRYTQALSVAKNGRYRMDFTNTSQYRILDNAGNSVLIPSVNATTVSLPVGLTISASISYLVFDGRGKPYSSSTSNGVGTLLSGDLIITVSGILTSKQVVVVSETGAVYVQ